MKKIVLACLIMVFSIAAYAQDSLRRDANPDTVFLKSDTATIASYASRYDPRKAILFAAILPGLGQVYNKKYWKLPLVYGGFAGFGYGVNFYQKGYKEFKGALFDLLESGESSIVVRGQPWSEQSLRTIVDRYRRERDFFIILSAGMYLLQMIDAHVDAHLKEFDLNPNLHVKIQPSMNNDMLTGTTTGISLIVKF
ncbi:MAG: hypothetical protein JNJ75_06065 [Cyclobacteriaceae bacterium]|nr:hypothetical protein [Cyclobacteriaceae bacterium]